jgi:galactonate dehydratase
LARNGWFVPARTPAEFGARARGVADKGFRGLKWDPFGKAWLTLSKQHLRLAVRCVGAVAQAVE